MASMPKMIEALTKRSEAQEAHMEQIMSKLEGSNEGSGNRPIDIGDRVETSAQRDPSKGKGPADIQVTAEGLIPVNQLKEFIAGTLKEEISSGAKSSFTYTKPYTARIEAIKMPTG